MKHADLRTWTNVDVAFNFQRAGNSRMATGMDVILPPGLSCGMVSVLCTVLTTSVVGKGIDLHARRGIITRFNVQTSRERSAFAQLSTVAHQMG